jgi:hypothetical protein
MRAKVYIETTIPSYLASRPSRDLLRRPDFDLFISEAVLVEARAGDSRVAAKRLDILKDIPVLALTDGIEVVTGSLLDSSIPSKAAADAVHIATATVYACEYLLTWNCTHIANAEIQRQIRRVVGKYGFDLPVICTPDEFMGADNEPDR